MVANIGSGFNPQNYYQQPGFMSGGMGQTQQNPYDLYADNPNDMLASSRIADLTRSGMLTSSGGYGFPSYGAGAGFLGSSGGFGGGSLVDLANSGMLASSGSMGFQGGGYGNPMGGNFIDPMSGGYGNPMGGGYSPYGTGFPGGGGGFGGGSLVDLANSGMLAGGGGYTGSLGGVSDPMGLGDSMIQAGMMLGGPNGLSGQLMQKYQYAMMEKQFKQQQQQMLQMQQYQYLLQMQQLQQMQQSGGPGGLIDPSLLLPSQTTPPPATGGNTSSGVLGTVLDKITTVITALVPAEKKDAVIKLLDQLKALLVPTDSDPASGEKPLDPLTVKYEDLFPGNDVVSQAMQQLAKMLNDKEPESPEAILINAKLALLAQYAPQHADAFKKVLHIQKIRTLTSAKNASETILKNLDPASTEATALKEKIEKLNLEIEKEKELLSKVGLPKDAVDTKLDNLFPGSSPKVEEIKTAAKELLNFKYTDDATADTAARVELKKKLADLEEDNPEYKDAIDAVLADAAIEENLKLIEDLKTGKITPEHGTATKIAAAQALNESLNLKSSKVYLYFKKVLPEKDQVSEMIKTLTLDLIKRKSDSQSPEGILTKAKFEAIMSYFPQSKQAIQTIYNDLINGNLAKLGTV